MSRAVRYRIRLRWYPLAAAVALLVSGLCFYGVWLDLSGVVHTLPFWITGPLALLTAPIGLWFGGISVARPVGLRLDESGISGFIIPPLAWSLVTDVGLHETPRYDGESGQLADQGHLFLGLRLADPKGFWSQVSITRKLLWMRRDHKSRWDILLPLDALGVQDTGEFLHTACDFYEGR